MSLSYNLSLLTILLIIIVGCNQSSEDSYNDNANSYSPPKIEQEPITQVLDDTIESIIVQVKEKKIIPIREVKKSIDAPVNYRVTPEQLDSMNKLIPVYDSLKYDGITVSYFTYLSNKLKGRPFFVDGANQINGAVMEILSTRLNDQTDVVLLIDKTGSMDDDWAAVESSLKEIMNQLSKYDNVRLGIASYGDKNYHLDFWYNMEDLSYGVENLETFMDTYSTMGNPDTRESVNDAIVKTVNNMSWNPESNRVMIVIGDAPSQLPPLSEYSDEEVIEICESMDVHFNLYPVIISAVRSDFNDAPTLTNFVKLYPNPAIDRVTIETTNFEGLAYDIIDLTGKTVLSGYLNSNQHSVDIRNLPSGNYLVSVLNQTLSSYHTSKLIKK